MTTFAVLEFPRAEGAEYMLRTLHQLQERHLIEIEDWAIVTWPLGAKHPRTRQLNHLTADSALSGVFWGMLFGLLFSVSFFGVWSRLSRKACSSISFRLTYLRRKKSNSARPLGSRQ